MVPVSVATVPGTAVHIFTGLVSAVVSVFDVSCGAHSLANLTRRVAGHPAGLFSGGRVSD